uniref:Clone 1276 transcribed RNA sequence n=1 Tax=Plectreurys tristis TaxID=33319 RepID=A0A0C4W5X7_PLETR|nr:hypothetical protein [Plectreurys tristis]
MRALLLLFLVALARGIDEDAVEKCLEGNSDELVESTAECALGSIGLLLVIGDQVNEAEAQCVAYFVITECVADSIAEKCGSEVKDLALSALQEEIKEQAGDDLDVSQCNEDELEKKVEAILEALPEDKRKRRFLQKRRRRFLFERRRRFIFRK